VFFGAAAALATGFFGLYRLRSWGVVVTMLTALVLGGVLVFTRVVPEEEMALGLAVLCALQLLAPVPMLVSMVTGRRLPSLSTPFAGTLRSGVVISIVIVASVGAVAQGVLRYF
jgi:hypothetical protein